MIHDWKQVYELYSKMRSGLFSETSPLDEVQDPLAILVARLTESYLENPLRSPEEVLMELETSLGVGRQQPELAQVMLRAIEVFRDKHLADAMQIYTAVKNLRHESASVFENVYAAALHLITSPVWHSDGMYKTADGLAAPLESPTPIIISIEAPRGKNVESHGVNIEGRTVSHFFRGHRSTTFELTPTIFRSSDSERPKDPELQSRKRRLSSLLTFLSTRDEFKDLKIDHLAAVAQHYSDITNVATWLLDVTLDPFIALFFASLNGQVGDIGSIYMFSVDEFRRLGAGANGLLGDFSVVHVPGVPRLERQRGAFITGSIPEAMKWFIPFEIQFRQHKGLVFEDVRRGISLDQLWKIEPDAIGKLMREWKFTDVESKEYPIFERVKNTEVTPQLLLWYLDLLVPGALESDQQTRTLLSKLVHFHLAINKHKQIPVMARSLNRLIMTAEDIVNDKFNEGRQLRHYVIDNHLRYLASNDTSEPLLFGIAKDIDEA